MFDKASAVLDDADLGLGPEVPEVQEGSQLDHGRLREGYLQTQRTPGLGGTCNCAFGV